MRIYRRIRGFFGTSEPAGFIVWHSLGFRAQRPKPDRFCLQGFKV